MPPKFYHRLQSLVARQPQAPATLAARVSRLLASSSGVDASSSTIFYILALLHSSLASVLIRKYEKLALAFAAKASQTMTPGETVIAAIEPPHLVLTEVCASIKAAGDAINDTRMFLRLWNLLNIFLWAKEARSNPSRDPITKLLVWAQVVANIGYQSLENTAFLIRKQIIGGKKLVSAEQSLWVWSGRFWLGHVVLELLRLGRVQQLKFREELGAQQSSTAADDKSYKSKFELAWRRMLYANIGWLPPSLLFSSSSEDNHSPAHEALVAVLGLVPSLSALQDAWQETL